MARRGRQKKYTDPILNPNRDRVRQLAAAIQQIDGELAELRKDRGEYLKSAKEAAIHTQALALAIKLAKMEAGKRSLFLDCFDKMRLDLGLDNAASELQPQTDLEDVIKASAKGDAPPADDAGAAAAAPPAKPKPNGNGAAAKAKGNGKAKGSDAALAAAPQHLAGAPKVSTGVLETLGSDAA